VTTTLTSTDNGCGISKEVMERIFEPFYSTKEVGKGTGLGLATVFGIANSHGGHIVCHSRMDYGTTFDLYLPAAGQGEISANEITPIDTEKPVSVVGVTENLDGQTILVVDDEEVIREFVEESMEFYGYRTILVASGEEALQKYHELGSRIDLVLLDISMPGMGGLNCLQGLLELDPEVKVIMASGYFPEGLKNDPIKQGASSFLNKPFKVEALLEKIRLVLG